MPVTINGDGSITGLSVGGLPNGTVDADTLASNAVTTVKIANNAVTSAKSTGLQRRISTGPIALAGESSVSHTVTTGVKKIEILVQDSSSNSNSNMKLQIGDAGGLETSGYGYASGLHRGSSTGREGTVTNFTDSFQTYGLDATSYNIYGTWKLWNPNSNTNTWVGEHIFWGDDATNHQFYGNGYKNLSATITTVTIAPLGGVFSDGNITIVETMGDT